MIEILRRGGVILGVGMGTLVVSPLWVVILGDIVAAVIAITFGVALCVVGAVLIGKQAAAESSQSENTEAK